MAEKNKKIVISQRHKPNNSYVKMAKGGKISINTDKQNMYLKKPKETSVEKPFPVSMKNSPSQQSLNDINSMGQPERILQSTKSHSIMVKEKF